MDRGGLKTLIFLVPFESAFRLRIISEALSFLFSRQCFLIHALPPGLRHSL